MLTIPREQTDLLGVLLCRLGGRAVVTDEEAKEQRRSVRIIRGDGETTIELEENASE